MEGYYLIHSSLTIGAFVGVTLVAFGLAAWKRRDRGKCLALIAIGLMSAVMTGVYATESVEMSRERFVYQRGFWPGKTRVEFALDEVRALSLRSESDGDGDSTIVWQIERAGGQIEEFSGDLLDAQAVPIINYLRQAGLEVRDSR